MLEHRTFRVNDEEYHVFTLTSSTLTVELLSYGATISKFLAPDAHGVKSNVVGESAC
jgi:hypothetical protein